MKLYNTFTREREELAPSDGKTVRMYSCGPTVYNFAHIGNMRTYVFTDTLRRALAYEGYKLQGVMNITDVGHLTGDADDGEDKMLVAMRREGKTAWDVAAFYADAFFRDLDRLNIERMEHYPRATEHIPEQIALVKQLEENGFTYRTSDGVYFDTSKLPEYGRLSGQKADEKKAGARVDMGEKKNPTDFALWKFSAEGAKRDMEWESPWGVGYPGWHLECSAMAKKYLGVPFDVHTGGVDHIAVHHENEIAQTAGADGALEANLWLHNEFITVDGGKMSKSLGNVYTLDDLAAKGFDPLALRYFFLGAHYRAKLNFTWDALEAAQNALKRLRGLVRSWGEPGTADPQYERSFDAALDDDLNVPQGLGVLWQLAEDDQVVPADKLATVLAFDRVLGLKLADEVGKKTEVPADVAALVEQRAAARAAKDWPASDRLREEIAARGFLVEDGPDGQTVRERD